VTAALVGPSLVKVLVGPGTEPRTIVGRATSVAVGARPATGVIVARQRGAMLSAVAVQGPPGPQQISFPTVAAMKVWRP
jgi:hypothetical protein